MVLKVMASVESLPNTMYVSFVMKWLSTCPCYIARKGLFRYKVFLYRAFILEQSSLDEMKGI